MNKKLDFAAAIFAFIAAVFWFLSAAGQLPPIGMYWLHAPETDPFYQALKFSARMSMVASVFSGLSALTLSGQAHSLFRLTCRCHLDRYSSCHVAAKGRGGFAQ